MIEDTIYKQLVALSSPRLWVFSSVTYLLGVAMGLTVFGSSSAIVPTWHFVLFICWMISLGMIAGLSYAKGSPHIVFPWEVLCNLRNLKNQRSGVSGDATISLIISSAFLILLFLVNLISLDSKILILSIWLLVADFIYDSPHIKGSYRSGINTVYGAVLAIPLFVGYVFITRVWPPTDLLVAGVCYGIAMGIYANAVRGEHVLSKNKSLGISAVFTVVCGYILSQYGVVYSLAVSSLVVVLICSAYAKDSLTMHKIHDTAFFLHFAAGILMGGYFFSA
jgi:hypothetical protein